MKKSEALEVTSIRYFETRRGLGYEAKTNKKDVTIWNDGDGGATYIEPTLHSIEYAVLDESELEAIIDKYEGVL